MQFFYMLFNFSAFKEIFLKLGFFFVKCEVVKIFNDQKIEQNNGI